MRPIGLTFKSGKRNRYSSDISGEIMLVHYCLSCEKISCNRIAGDDNAYAVLNLLNFGTDNNLAFKEKIKEFAIELLTIDYQEMVSIALLGKAYMDFIE